MSLLPLTLPVLPPAPTGTRLTVRECSITEARAAVGRLHRHLPPPPGALLAFRVEDERRRGRGWALVGRPVSRHLQADGWVEVTRVATDGSRNACSALYGACARWARSEGHRIVTYTLESEPGSSLRGAGWVQTGTTNPRMWDRPGRPRSGGLLIAKRRWSPPWCA